MAGRIPQTFIDELLDRIDIIEVIDRRVPLKKAGKNYKACCPFHNEKTPSFNASADRQFYHCFGCGAGGNAIGFVMDFDNVDFPTAIETLASSLGLEVPREQQSPAARREQQKKQTIYDVLQFATRFYQAALRNHPDKKQVIEYLKQRGMSGEVARDFAIGFAPAGWDNLLKHAQQDATFKQHIEQLEAAGLLVKKENGDYYDRFRHRVIFPIRDNRGRVIAFGGRVLGDDKPKYLNSPESSVFHKQRELYGLYEARRQNAQLEMLVLVEGYMDVVALFQYGINYAVATLGTASSQFHLEKIFRHTPKLVVCFDGDEAGQQAAQRLLETALPAMQDGREISFLFLPEGEDPDTFIRNKGKEAFIHALNTATPLEDLLFENEKKNIAIDSDAGKARLNNRLLEQIKLIPEGFFKQSQLKKLAALTNADLNLLQDRLAEISQRTPQRESATPTGSQNRPQAQDSGKQNTDTAGKKSRAGQASEKPERQSVDSSLVLAISSLLYFPELAQQIELQPIELQPQAEERSPLHQTLRALYDYIRERAELTGQTPTLPNILGHWHGTDTGQTLTRCASIYVEPDTREIAQQQLDDALSNIEKSYSNQPIQHFIESLSTKSSPGELTDKEKELLRTIGRNKSKP